MNIAFVNATKSWGGVKTWTLDFAAQLQHPVDRPKHNITVYARQPEFIAACQVRLGVGNYVDFGPDLNPRAIRYFYKEFKLHKTQIVIINVGKDLSTAGIAAKLLGLPVVQRIGLPNDIRLDFKTKALHSWIQPQFLCPCKFIAQGFLANLPYLRADQVKVILNGKELITPKTTPTATRQLVCTQQLNADKGHAQIFQALAPLQHDFKLHIYGTGREEANLKALADSLNLQDKLVWHGFDAQVTAKLPLYDIFILASLSEGLPNTLLEALAAGLLPVSRQVGGIAEVYPASLNPWLLPPQAQASDFQLVLDQALSLDDLQLAQAQAQAQQACLDNCYLPKQAKEFESWLQSLLV